MKLIILCRIFKFVSAFSQSEVRASFEDPILESSRSSLALGEESVFVTPDNISSIVISLGRQQPPVL